MQLPPRSTPDSDAALRARREELRRSLARVNTAGVAVVLVTILLAVAAAYAALRAGRQADLTSAATQRALDELWKSYLTQARAGRLSGVLGRKDAGLHAIAAAAAIRPSADLRNEAIAHLALLDLEPTSVSWTNSLRLGYSAVDVRFERSLESDSAGTVRIRRIDAPTNAFTLRTTNGFVAHGSFSSDARTLALIHQNRALALWDLSTRTQFHHEPEVIWSAFDRVGQHLIAGSDTAPVRILIATNGQEAARFRVSRGATGGVFDSTGALVAIALPNAIEVWNWREGRRVETWPVEQPALSLAWQGELLAASDRTGEVRVWNRVTKRSRRLQAHQSLANHLCFNPAGDILCSTSYDGTTKVWNPHTGRMLLSTSHGFATQFSPDGRQLLFRNQSGWSVWDVSAPDGFTTLNCVSGASLNVWHLDFSPTGRWLAATKPDGICIFDSTTGRRVQFVPVNQGRCAYFVHGGSNLLTTSTGRIALWPIETEDPHPDDGADPSGPNETPRPTLRVGPRELIPFTNFTHLEPGTLSADRRHLVLPVSQTAAAVIDLDARVETLRLTNAILPKLSSFSPDRRWIVSGTFHGRGTRVWDGATGAVLHEFRDGNSSAYFSPDGRTVVAAGSSAYRIYEAGTWKPVRSLPTDSGSDLPNIAAFTGDGAAIAVVKELNRVELLDTQGWDRLASLSPPDPHVVTWMAFSPGNDQLAVATSQDLVQLWDLRRIRERLAALGLDWSAVGPGKAAPASLPGPATPLTRLILPLAVGVLIVIACTVFIRHRQQRLLAAYFDVERLAEDQYRQLDRIQSEVMHAQKMKALGTLAAGIAHDFNNLLSVIRMSNQLTSESARTRGGLDDVAENAAEIDQAVQQGKKLVRSMLGYSREDPDDSKPFSIPELVEDTVGLLSKQFLGGIALTLELDRNTPPAAASRSRLEQILLNLIVNASESMNGSGALRISVRPRSGEDALPERLVLRPRPAPALVELSVTDSGPGIAPEILPRIFEPFFTTKHRGTNRGTGLGLSTVYATAEQDGLGLAVESRPGQGARFTVFIPCAPVAQ